MTSIVIGGGIVGCHIALALANRGAEVFLLEKEPSLGEHTSTRNSGVIHGGIYYEPGSLKAILCVRGRHLSYEFLKRHGVPYRKCGKIVVALDAREEKSLEKLKNYGDRNGVENLRILDASDIRKLEHRARGIAALHSPETGIVDAAAYIRTIEKLLKLAGVAVVKQCEVLEIGERNLVRTTRGEIQGEILINAAGLYSDRISALCGLEGYEIVPYKGDYYNTTERAVNGLVYPVPDSELTLGIHLTPTLGDELLIGPSVMRVKEKEDYTIRTPREEFEAGAVALIPDMDTSRIYPGYSGNRPKVYYQGRLLADFVIREQKSGRVHLLGIESPGLTAAPAIAEYVVKLLF